MCNFNAICRRCCHCAPCAARSTILDKTEAQQLNEPQITIYPVSTEITSMSNSGSSWSTSTDLASRCLNTSTARSSPRASSHLASMSSANGSKASSRIAALPTVDSTIKSITSSRCGSVLATKSIKTPSGECTIRSANGSTLTSRVGSTLTTRDPSRTTSSKDSGESQRSGVCAPIQRTEINQDCPRCLPQRNTMNCCNCYCRQFADQQRDIQDKLEAIRAEIKPNERKPRPFSYLRAMKPKQEPPKPEKELEKVQTKTKPRKKAKGKALASQVKTETQEGESPNRFECNVPMRVSVPTSICLGAPWDLFASIPKNLPNANNNNKLRALPAPVADNKSLARAGRNLPPTKTPAILPKTARELCITVKPMGYKPSVTSPPEEVGPSEPSLETRDPKKKKQKKKLPSKKKEKLNYSTRKGGNLCSCCFNRNRDKFKELGQSIGRENGNRKQSIDEINRETYRIGSDNRSIREDANPRDSHNGSDDYSISADKMNTVPRIYKTQRGSDNYSISEDKVNTNPGDFTYRRGSVDSTISKNSKPRDHSFQNESVNEEKGDHTSRKGSEHNSLRKDMVNQYRSCYCIIIENREQSRDGEDKNSQNSSYHMADPKSGHCRVIENREPSHKSIDGDNGDFNFQKGSESYSLNREEKAACKSCHCSTIKMRDPSHESHLPNDGESRNSRRGIDNMGNPQYCPCDLTRRRDPSHESLHSSDRKSLSSRKGSLDMPKPQSCPCDMTRRQESSHGSHQPTDGENRNSRKGSHATPKINDSSRPDVARRTKSDEYVPFNRSPQRSKSKESIISRREHSFVSGRYPSPTAWNFDQMRYSISSILLRSDLHLRRNSQESLHSRRSKRTSAQSTHLPQTDPISVKHRKNSNDSILSPRSDKSMVSQKLRRTSSRRDSLPDSSAESAKSGISNRVSVGKRRSFHNSSRSSKLSNYSNKSLVSRRKTEDPRSSFSESMASQKSKRSLDSTRHSRNTGGRSKSAEDWNNLAQFIKMFSEQHTEPAKHLADKSTYVRTIDKNKKRSGHQKKEEEATEFKECRAKPAAPETLQDLLADMPPSSYNRLIGLLKQGNRNIKKQRRSSHVMNGNKSQLFQLLSSLPTPPKSFPTSHSKQNDTQLENDHIPAIIDAHQLCIKHRQVLDQNSDQVKATMNIPVDQTEEVRNNLHYRSLSTKEHRKYKHRNDQNVSKVNNTADNKFQVKDLKICLLRQESHNSPPVLEEYNVEAFTRSSGSNPLQRRGKQSQLSNGRSKTDIQKLHAINEENVKVVWSDLKRFCRKSRVKSSDILQKPVVLVPYRPDNEHNGRLVCMCKPDEWKELKMPRTAASRRAERAFRCGPPDFSIRRKFTKKVSTCGNCCQVESKLYEYLRKAGTPNRYQTLETHRNSLGTENLGQIYSSTAEPHPQNQPQSQMVLEKCHSKVDSQDSSKDSAIPTRSQSPKSRLPLTDQKHLHKRNLNDELQDSSTANSLSNSSKSPRLRSFQTDSRASQDLTERRRSQKSSILNPSEERHTHNCPQSEEADRTYNLMDESQGSQRASDISNRSRSPSPTAARTPQLERVYQLNEQSRVSSNSGKTEAPDCDIVTHLRPRLLCSRSKDLRHQHRVSNNVIPLETRAPLTGQHCVEHCTCSTNMSQDLQRQKETQLQQELQQANLEFDRRQQQQLEACERVEYGRKRREEAERICCIGYTQQQLQQRQLQKHQRLQQQQRHIQEQIQQQQQQFTHQQQQQQQKHRQEENAYNCYCRCSQNLQEQQTYQKEKSCFCQYSQNHLQQQTQQQQQNEQQQLQHMQEEDNNLYSCQYAQNYQQQQLQAQQEQQTQLKNSPATSHFHQQHMLQQQNLKLQEENCYAKCWQNPQQQQQFNCANGLIVPEEHELQCVPCCYCNVATEPDLSNIRSSFYQQTLLKYGVQRFPEGYFKQIPPDTDCSLPCPCCSCCAYSYGQQQQQQQQQSTENM